MDLFVTCLVDQFAPEAGLAAARVLQDAGCNVRFKAEQTCCGQPAMNLGHRDEARAAARRIVATYGRDAHPIVVPSGSCATMMRRLMPSLFAEGSAERAAAQRVAERVVEWSSFLRARDYRPVRRDGLPPVVLHDACHGMRELGIREEPRGLLTEAGYPLVPLERNEECCGFGGAFSVLMPEASGVMLRDKLSCLQGACARGASIAASLDVGCLLHLRGGAARAATAAAPRLRFCHVAELLAEGLGPPGGDDAPGA